jgi:hypothetical protein
MATLAESIVSSFVRAGEYSFRASAAGVRAYTSSLLNKSQHAVILSEASEYQCAAFGALNQFRR